VLCGLVSLMPAGASAHSRSRSFSIWTVQAGSVAVYIEAEADDIRESTWVDANRDEELTAAEVAGAADRIAKLLDPYAEVSDVAGPCDRDGETTVELASPPTKVYLRARWRCPRAVTKLKIALRLHEPFKVTGHRNLANFKLPRGRSVQHVFSPGAATFEFEVEQPPEQVSAWAAFRVYFLLGGEHILIGWDHLLFLAALLLIWPRLTEVMLIVSSFTVAHSLTLVLATLDVVRPPDALVEVVIAASIIFVAVENIVRQEAPRRWALTFVFGLVHGFGFSGVLRELGLPPDHLLASLVAFNVGVEAGQLVVVLPLVGMLAVGRKMPAPARRRVTQALSVLVILPASWWLLERITA
jgi:hypothetical protein